MANAHSFPLLRLPNLAYDHVVKVMEVREQYLFATLSKKSKRIAKNGIRRLSYILNIVMQSDEIEIELKKNGTVPRFEIKLVPTHSDDVVSDSSNRICLRVEDIRESIIGILPFLEDLFKFSRFVLFTSWLPNDFTKEVLATVKSLGISIHKLLVEVQNPDNEMFVWLMENCRDVKRFSNSCATFENFLWDSQEPFNFEYLSFWNAPWLTLDHITRLFSNCKFFQVNSYFYNTKLSMDDVNQLVKEWINDSGMEYFQIMMHQTTNLNYILRGIEKEPVRRALVENRLEPFARGKAFKIRQTCGKEAVVCIWREIFMINAHFNNPECDFWKYDDEEEDEDESEEDEDEEEDDFEDEEVDDGLEDEEMDEEEDEGEDN